MITGMYQTTIGAHHHRSSRGSLKINLPSDTRTVPELFRAAGYYTCNANEDGSRPGKEDYNFDYQRDALYDGVDWSSRADGQPFFAQVQLRGGKLRDVPQWREEVEAGLDDLVTADEVTVPPYYPDHPAIRDDWAAYLNAVQYTDREIGAVLERLRSEAILANTVVFLLTDHGISHARGKQFLYDEGSKVPLVVWAPGRLAGGQTRTEPIAHIDIAATSMALAGINIPTAMQSRPLFDGGIDARDHVVLARDRCDETTDRIRAIRKGDYKYIRNYFPRRPYLQPCAYKDHKPFMSVLRDLHAAGALNETQTLHFAPNRPMEELYDLTKDPFEIHNLANENAHRDRLTQFRKLLDRWEIESDDRGRFPESEAMYDSDMAAYLSPQLREQDPAYAGDVEANITLMKKWRMEGK
jgi:arylsulfatase A-like enzyme